MTGSSRRLVAFFLVVVVTLQFIRFREITSSGVHSGDEESFGVPVHKTSEKGIRGLGDAKPSSPSSLVDRLFRQTATPPSVRTADPYQHAIIIPYRDRQFHLDRFLEYMDPYLQRHFPKINFSLWILEQDDDQLFNRAWLANVGLKEILKQAPQTKCVILHDVDLIPNTTEAQVPYTSCNSPTQLARALEHWGWRIPYATYSGGVTSLSLHHWELVNGFSNDYAGWGGEDDDLYHRMRLNGLLHQPTLPGYLYTPVARRPPFRQGAFRTISQSAEHHVQHKGHSGESNIYSLLRLMFYNSGRWKQDGLNDVYYSINKQTVHRKDTGGFKSIHHIWTMPEKSFQSKSSNRNPQPILELVPIPHTGADNALTAAAAKAGIVWGACHYVDSPEAMALLGIECPIEGSGDYKHTASLEATYAQSQKPWHLPAKHFSDILYGNNPLEGTQRFSVIRNPYDRAISLYREIYNQQNVNVNLTKREDPTLLNAFLQALFQGGNSQLMPPQVDYVFMDEVNTTTRYVQHIVRYEQLIDDLSELLQDYEYLKEALDWEALRVSVQEPQHGPSWLGYQNLTDATIAVLNEVFNQDFLQLKYAKLPVSYDLPTLPTRYPSPPILAPLQLLHIPYTGGGALSKAASKAGVVWGACHFTTSSDLCPPPEGAPQGGTGSKIGDMANSVRFRAAPHESQTPWLLMPTRFRPRLFRKGTATFAVVRNPYDRAIAFYRDVYDKLYGGHSPQAELTLEQLEDRENPKTLNTFLQNVLVRCHHPHQPDIVSPPPLQAGYARWANHVVHYESWRSDLDALLPLYNLSYILSELPTEDSFDFEYAEQGRGVLGAPGWWLQISDLEDVTIDMLNRLYALDLFYWYKSAKRQVNVTTINYWNESQRIPRGLINSKGKISMSTIPLMGKIAAQSMATERKLSIIKKNETQGAPVNANPLKFAGRAKEWIPEATTRVVNGKRVRVYHLKKVRRPEGQSESQTKGNFSEFQPAQLGNKTTGMESEGQALRRRKFYDIKPTQWANQSSAKEAEKDRRKYKRQEATQAEADDLLRQFFVDVDPPQLADYNDYSKARQSVRSTVRKSEAIDAMAKESPDPHEKMINGETPDQR